MNLTNLANIGILLIGVALIIMAVADVYKYLDMREMYSPPPPPMELFPPQAYQPPPIHAYCQDDVVVISPQVDLRDVKVVDVDGRVYCTFASIKAGAEKLCKVGNATAYLVEAGNFSRAVFCYRPVPVTPVRD
jgi:hypothetical protein